MREWTRRRFLSRGTLTAAAVGVVSAVPGLPAVLSAGAAEAPAVAGDAPAVTGDLSGPLVAHITDLQSGEINLSLGESTVVYKNPQLVAQLWRAAGH